MIRKLLYFLGLAVMLNSCVTVGILTSSVNSNEIKDIQYFEPISYVNYIEKRDLMFYNDSLSAIGYYKVDSVLAARSSKYRLSEKFIAKNDKEQERLDFEILSVVESIAKNRSLSGAVLPPTVKKVIRRTNNRFGMAVIHVGYLRSSGNYAGKLLKASLGIQDNYLFWGRTKVYIVIFDTLNENLAFYGESFGLEETHPTNSYSISKKINKIFRVYY